MSAASDGPICSAPRAAAALAGDLFASLARLLDLADATEVHPGHGAGSLCGAGIGHEPSSTIGHERRDNSMLRCASKQAFIEAVLATVPETPPYFSRMKRLNAAGAPLRGLADGPPRLASIRPAAAAALAADGAFILDLRSAAAFAAGHPDGAINLGFGPKMGYWAGWVIPPDSPLLILADDPAQHADAALQLLRIGLDRIEGTIAGGFEGWLSAGLPVGAIERIRCRAAASGDRGVPGG